MAINPIQPVQPYQFNTGLPDSWMQAAKLGQMALQSQEIARNRQVMDEAMKRRDQAVSTFMGLQDPSMRDISNFLSQLPEDQAKALAPVVSKIPEEKIRGQIQFGTQVMTALRRDPTVATTMLEERAKAEENSGNQQNAAFYRRIADDVKTNGPNNAFRLAGVMIGTLPGGKDAIDSLAKAEDAQRQMEGAPVAAKKAEAEAIIKQQEAAAGVTPKFVEAEEGILQWNPTTKKLEPTGYKTKAGKEVSISLSEGQKGFENATTLRKEFNSESKPFNEINGAFGRMQQAYQNSKTDITGTSDLALIFGYMKMLDPGSTVREGEAASAANAGGVGERVRNLYNEVTKGQKLTPKIRDEFMAVARRNYTENQVNFNKLKTRYRGLATRAGINPEDVITAEFQEPPAPRPGGSAPTVDELDKLLAPPKK